MSEKSNASLNKEQEKISPQIENEILELLDGDLKDTALGFVEYLKAGQLAPRQWFGPNYWRIPYEKNYLCGIVVDKGKWRLWFFSGNYSGEIGEGFIKTIHDGVRPCVSCTGDDCPKGKDTTVFGKEFANTCFQFPIQFENPNAIDLDCIKELIEYWKEVAPYSDSWHCH